ncbi:uncharacterized protein LOC129587680 [Paramacrobiotus metropolitanus]|uniref:uncharacterized protein LOC129587680 n=1 Tax=Paramacrobiotus metropolitanus TaxID=2943436 RepID=UPI0024461DB1|nr:uncharacterized protein LOC129587680 [Paramacrobiotus metropolitanus]
MIASFFVVDFMHINHDLKHNISSNGNCSKIEWFRTSHNTLCILLEVADNVMSPFILVSLICAVFQILLGIFVLVDISQITNATIIFFFSLLFWCLQYLFQLCLILFAGAVLHDAAHSPAINLHQIDQTSLSITETLQLQTFLNALSCNNIGFTAWKMFTVNYGAIVTLFGLYLTYQILVFQLKLDLNLDAKIDERIDCNCSSVDIDIPKSILNISIHGHIEL